MASDNEDEPQFGEAVYSRQAEDDDEPMDLDDDDLAEEDLLASTLGLPPELSGLSLSEKRNLWRFKKEHNQREWEEEILQRVENLGRKADFERLKQLKNAQGKDSTPAPTRTAPRRKAAPVAKKTTKAIIPDSDDDAEADEAEEEEEAPKSRGKPRGGKKLPAPAKAAPASKKRGKRSKEESEEEEEAEESEEEEEDAAKDEDDEDEEQADESEGEDESDDDLFNSSEEEEINNKYRTSAPSSAVKKSAGSDDDDDAGAGGKRKRGGKKLRKTSDRGGKKKKRSAWDDDEDDDDDDDDEQGSDDDNLGAIKRRTHKRGRRSANDDDDEEGEDRYQEDGDIGRIKKSFRSNRETLADLKKADRVQASKEIVVNSLEDYRRLMLSNSQTSAESGPQSATKGQARFTAVAPQEDDFQPATYSDYLQLFLRREDIAKILDEPYFREYVQGCFVRYMIDSATQTYRACEIVSVSTTERPYRIFTDVSATGDKETNYVFQLSSKGVSMDRRKLDKISNHTLTEKEWEFHIEGLKKEGKPLLFKRDVRTKKQRMQDLKRHYIYSNEEVQALIAKRTGINQVFATDYTTAVSELQRQLAKATAERDFDTMERVRKEMEKLEYENERQKRAFDNAYKAQTDVNRRMREKNTQRDMEAGMRKRRADQEAAARGEQSNALSDPFIRRETRPKNLWITQSKRPESASVSSVTATQESTASSASAATAASTAAPAAAAGASQTSTASAATSSTATAGASAGAPRGKRVNDDDWPIPLIVDLEKIRKKFKERHGVDPLAWKHETPRDRALRKSCASLPPLGSAAREAMRGRGSISFATYKSMQQQMQPEDQMV